MKTLAVMLPGLSEQIFILILIIALSSGYYFAKPAKREAIDKILNAIFKILSLTTLIYIAALLSKIAENTLP